MRSLKLRENHQTNYVNQNSLGIPSDTNIRIIFLKPNIRININTLNRPNKIKNSCKKKNNIQNSMPDEQPRNLNIQ